ncbi:MULTISPECIES: TetR/AcrR family transcriptional regulator [Acinetobacter]|uniref:TetR/AcrR family transcriptional regulator n=1 Tax=Acinetobacter piscicola TaxID=2006115 RepID=A0A7S6VZA0_9GAMM|nr:MULTISPECIES: TetR/AcrR family transcriptional regulator [Acinetobacter]MDM1757598.1 TetR/AcrR family transcriptional regulator [Acinetobacter sp. 256-1]MDM1761071.1 TetR/AcrR family transcriptional regulator [Acinetobacter sp. 251-1]QOW47590.1 TetR/AcrR family transcriptional regulator [Acinetobacter piscicola]
MKNTELLQRIYVGKRAELKRTILNEALDCFLKYGIETTNIDMIRARAETSVGAIYHHFKNKEGIVQTLYLSALQDQAQRREQALLHVQSLEEAIQAIVSSYIDWVVDFPDFARFLYMSAALVNRNDEDLELKHTNQLRNQEFMKRMQCFADTEKMKNIPPELLLSLMIGATESYCRAWLSHKVKTSPQNYKKVLANTAWNNIAYFPE